MNKYNNEDLPKFIISIFDILEKHNVFFWLDAGSLLKGIREKSILNSSDIDLSISSESTENVLLALNELSIMGYSYNFNGGYPMLEDLVTIYLPKKINKIKHIDIYIFHKSDNFFFRRSFHKPLSNSKSRYLFYLSKKILNIRPCNITSIDYGLNSYFYFSLDRIFARLVFLLYEFVGTTTWIIVPFKFFANFNKLEIHGRKFNIPVLNKEYLKFRYGDNWQTPIDRSIWFKQWKNSYNHILKIKKLRTNLNIKRYWVKF